MTLYKLFISFCSMCVVYIFPYFLFHSRTELLLWVTHTKLLSAFFSFSLHSPVLYTACCSAAAAASFLVLMIMNFPYFLL